MPEIVGNLLKRRGGKFGAHMKQAWQNRYFELNEGVIAYYEDSDKKSKSKPRGKLELDDISLVKFTTYENAPPYNFTLELVPSGKEEKWRLCASSQTEMNLWCESLEKYVRDVVDLSSKSTSNNIMDLKNEGRDLTGFLLKRRGGKFGAHMNAWQGRYFEIKNGVICYYEEDVTNVKPRGKMSLVGGEVSLEKYTTYEHAAPSKYTFELVPHDSAEERWRLCAASEEDMQQWCRSIEANLGSQTQGSERAVTEEESSERQDSRGSGDGGEIGDSSGIIDQDKYVSGGDDVIMSLAWQKRSARTMSGIDRVACEAAARASMLMQEKEGQGKEHESSGAGVSVLEFDDLELDEEPDGGRMLDESIAAECRQNLEDNDDSGHGLNDENGGSFSPFKGSIKQWVSKRKSQLSNIMTEKSSSHGSNDEDSMRNIYLDEKPLETEETFCV